MYSAEILLKTATIREVNSTEIDSYFTYDFRRAKHRITHHYSAKLQTTKQTFTTSKHSIEFAYSDFPCHLKDKLNRRSWTREKGRRRKIDQHDDSAPCGGPDGEIPPAPGRAQVSCSCSSAVTKQKLCNLVS